jgi:AraC family transcriptional regulator
MQHEFRVGDLYAQAVQEDETANLVLSETAYGPNLTIPTHTHQRPYFSLTLQGASTEIIEKQKREYRTLSLAFFPAGLSHANDYHHAQTRCFNLELENSWDTYIDEANPAINHPIEFSPGIMPWLTMRLYHEFRLTSQPSALSIESLVFELLAETSRHTPTKTFKREPRWVQTVTELLHDEFMHPLALNDIAQAVGVHPIYLARIFRRSMGCSVGDYVRQLRMDHACRQLADDQIPLGVVAVNCGYYDQSHFSKAFKVTIGMTPQKFRQMLHSHSIAPQDLANAIIA